ncbi:hypothetical protein GE061_006330 [Apolygus lucorum]|uniref:Uncharacterized protein n=1 Tax=Apolygus lucorum TaxID=248454 RepID=A0A6A4J8H9_APOLU|nr:hypothetical protein GE061_006330 [Apolygus lucorum]
MIVPIIDIQAVFGDPVYLPCDISIPPGTQQDAVVLVLWYREDLGTPIYRMELSYILTSEKGCPLQKFASELFNNQDNGRDSSDEDLLLYTPRLPPSES